MTDDTTGLTPDQLEALREVRRVRSLLQRADTWPMTGEGNLYRWIDEMRALLPVILEQLASVTAERDALRQQAERLTTALRHIAEWRHGNGCEVGKYGWVYECSCAGPGMWAIARDALAQEDVP